MTLPSASTFKEGFRDYLREAGHFCTNQREQILEEILTTKDHFDAEELLEQLRRKKRSIGRATIYRTLRHLEESGIIRRIDFGEDHFHYELTQQNGHHEHLRCTGCGQVIEFADSDLESSLSSIARRFSFTITQHRVQLFGICKSCNTKRGVQRP